MSFEPKHSDALLGAPWLTKQTGEGRWLFKYAAHPDREGYVFVATDLEGVFYETLTAAAIPSRLAALRGESLGGMDAFAEAEGVLRQLARVTREGWDSAQVDVKEHGFFDRVVHLRAGPFSWDFQMAEMRVPLPFVARHLVGPLAELALTQAVDGDAVDKVGALVQDPFVLERWKTRAEQTESKEEPYSSPVPTPSPPPLPSPPRRPAFSQASPPPRPAPSQTSQRTKREREQEEEEAVERRREEMKRRMGAGKGGRLGQRRR